MTEEKLAAQETRFARAFAKGDLSSLATVYQPDVVYISPTPRLHDWPRQIVGVERTIAFIQLTLRNCTNIDYTVVESVVFDTGASAFVRIRFDWTRGDLRLRAYYVVLYRYRDDLIAQQELYYDPSAELDILT